MGYDPQWMVPQPLNQITQAPNVTVTVNVPSEKPTPDPVPDWRVSPAKHRDSIPMGEVLSQIETALDETASQIEDGSLELRLLSNLRGLGKGLEVATKGSEEIDPEIAKMLQDLTRQLNDLADCDLAELEWKFKAHSHSIFDVIEKVNDRDRSRKTAVKCLHRSQQSGQLQELKVVTEKEDPEIADGFQALLSSLQSLVLPPL
jgi:hypothetical protein